MILQAAAGTVKFNSGKADQQKVALLGPQGMPRSRSLLGEGCVVRRKYLIRLAARRVLRGEPPAKDIAEDAYWLERAKRHAEDKTEFKKKKAE